MQRARLRKAAEFLVHDVKDGWFDLSSWASEGFNQKECGSTACGLGWATVAFPRGALMLVEDSSSFDVVFTNRKGTKFYGFDAAQQFFGIGAEEAYQLFDPGAYDDEENGREDVAQRMIELARKP